MVELLGRALRDRRSAPEADTSLEVEGRMIVLSPSEVWDEMKPLEDGGRPHNVARDALRERLIHVVVERANDDSVSRGRRPIIASEVRGNTGFNNFLDRVWPTFSPQEVLRDLLASERRLREHRWDLFEESEILLIARPPQARLPDEPWSAADLALIDEIEVLLNGLAEIKRYQHVIVDEAQDLSPMQLRAIQRRRAKGITILGDLAQATGPWAHTTWDEVSAELGSAEEASLVELTVGYRVPGEVMAVASRIAESLNLPVTIPEPVREVGELPRFVASDGEPAVRTALTIVREYLARGLLVGLIAPDASIGEVAAALRYEDLPFGDGRETTTRPITLLSATASKGLEFDAVVVLEPIDICDNGDGGLNELFVAVTRTTTALAVVHAKPLPPELTPFVSPDTNDVARHAAKSDKGTGGEAADADLADVEVAGIVDEVAQVIADALDPAAIDEFLTRLAKRLNDSED